MKTKNLFILLLLIGLFCSQSMLFAATTSRLTIQFNENWQFFLGDNQEAKNINFDDSSWRKLNVLLYRGDENTAAIRQKI